MNSVLDFAKLDAGRMEYRIEPVVVASVLRDVESVIAPLAHAKRIRFPRDCANSHLAVAADREKLTQILVNLFVNAAKFTGRGGTISPRCESHEGRVLFRIEDNGIGSAPDQLEQIFDPFQQVSQGHTRNQEGTGLGLAISRSLARGMGGDITVESTLGEGSTFTLDLALSDTVPAGVEASASPPEVEDRRSGDDRRSGEDRRNREIAGASAT